MLKILNNNILKLLPILIILIVAFTYTSSLQNNRTINYNQIEENVVLSQK